MMTGDAAVNAGAPIICCTAEILANIALRDGAGSPWRSVVMDEFHFYADPDRGWAWQVPLLELPRAQFLLMSATLGDVARFETTSTRRTGRPTADGALGDAARSRSTLDYRHDAAARDHRGAPRRRQGADLHRALHPGGGRGAGPGADEHQRLHAGGEGRIAEAIGDFRFSPGFGKTLSRFVRHGIGVHHAGMLPKYRRLVERLAQAGAAQGDLRHRHARRRHQRADPHRAVHRALQVRRRPRPAILSAREFHQIAGRAGRAGFDAAGLGASCRRPST